MSRNCVEIEYKGKSYFVQYLGRSETQAWYVSAVLSNGKTRTLWRNDGTREKSFNVAAVCAIANEKRREQREAETVKPEAETVKPEAETVKPEAETVKPEAETVKPEAETVKPEARQNPPRFVFVDSAQLELAGLSDCQEGPRFFKVLGVSEAEQLTFILKLGFMNDWHVPAEFCHTLSVPALSYRDQVRVELAAMDGEAEQTFSEAEKRIISEFFHADSAPFDAAQTILHDREVMRRRAQRREELGELDLATMPASEARTLLIEPAFSGAYTPRIARAIALSFAKQFRAAGRPGVARAIEIYANQRQAETLKTESATVSDARVVLEIMKMETHATLVDCRLSDASELPASGLTEAGLVLDGWQINESPAETAQRIIARRRETDTRYGVR